VPYALFSLSRFFLVIARQTSASDDFLSPSYLLRPFSVCPISIPALETFQKPTRFGDGGSVRPSSENVCADETSTTHSLGIFADLRE
jgi:hypothetical protein